MPANQLIFDERNMEGLGMMFFNTLFFNSAWFKEWSHGSRKMRLSSLFNPVNQATYNTDRVGLLFANTDSVVIKKNSESLFSWRPSPITKHVLHRLYV